MIETPSARSTRRGLEEKPGRPGTLSGLGELRVENRLRGLRSLSAGASRDRGVRLKRRARGARGEAFRKNQEDQETSAASASSALKTVSASSAPSAPERAETAEY